MLFFRCERCGKESQLLTIKEASTLVERSRRTIESWVARKRVHVMETAGGQALICVHSLIRPRCCSSNGQEVITGESLARPVGTK